MKRKTLFFLLGLFVPVSIYAYDFRFGDLYYDITSNTKPYTVAVTFNSDIDAHISKADIPETVTYNDKNYKVTSISYAAFKDCINLSSVTIPNSVTAIEDDAFYNCTNLSSVTIPNSVTAIGDDAFNNCTNLSSVTIPNSVTAIGRRAFDDCTSLSSIIVPNSVTMVGEQAFSGVLHVVYHGTASYSRWGALSVNGYVDGNLIYEDATKKYLIGCLRNATGAITIPNSVTAIGPYAFYGCEGITNITIPNSVVSIDKYAFSGCIGLYSVTLPNGITRIGYSTFENCTGLSSITIPNSVTEIYNDAFSGCTALKSITIPNKVIDLGSNVFTGCVSLKSITLPTSITTIPRGIFIDCTALTSITIPNTVTSIESGAFSHCTALKSVAIPNKVTSIGTDAFEYVNNIMYKGTASGSPWGAKNVNGYIDGYLVYDSAAKTQLLGCSTAATGAISVPNSVTSIGNYAFMDCTGLTSITIPNSVKTIGEQAFYGCTGLTSITIPNSVTSLGNYAFMDCTGLISVTIGNSLKTIGEQAFYGCTGLTSITIPNSVTSIGTLAFSGVKNIVYHGTATSSYNWGATCMNGYVDGYLVYDSAAKTRLMGCSSAATGDIIIPNTVTIVMSGAFEGCTGITSVAIPNSVIGIGEESFRDCANLKSVNLGQNVTIIGNGAFAGCTGLISVVWNAKKCKGDDDWDAYYSPFYSTLVDDDARTNITSFVFGEEVEIIPNYLCYGMSKLTSITIPKNVTSIGTDAFGYCSELNSIVWNAKTCSSWSSDSDAPFYSARNSIKIFTFGEEVTNISAHLCYDMSKLTSIVWNAKKCDDWSSCSDVPFYDSRNNIASFTFGDKVERIPTYLCYGMSKLTSITIPKSVTSIGDEAFYSCSNLINTKYMGNIAGWCNIKFKDSSSNPVQYSGNLYINDMLLTKLEIPNGITTVNNYAFYNCKDLISITIPKSVTHIGDEAFCGCSKLREMHVAAIVPPVLSANSFYGVDRNIPVYVYNDAVEYYQNDFYWKEFNIIGVGTGVENINGDNASTMRKIIRNGQVLILRGNEVYTVLGEKVE